MRSQIRIYKKAPQYKNRLVQILIWSPKTTRWYIFNNYISIEDMKRIKDKLDERDLNHYKRRDMDEMHKVGFCRKALTDRCQRENQICHTNVDQFIFALTFA